MEQIDFRVQIDITVISIPAGSIIEFQFNDDGGFVINSNIITSTFTRFITSQNIIIIIIVVVVVVIVISVEVVVVVADAVKKFHGTPTYSVIAYQWFRP